MKFFPFLSLLLVFTACTEPFEVDYQSIEPKLVIDAVLTDTAGGSLVLLSRSVPLTTPSVPPAVSDAVVTLTNGAGTRYTATLLDSGAFSFPGVSARPGETWTLQVQEGGNSYTATSALALPLQLDSVTFEYRPASPPVMDEGYIARLHFPPTPSGQYFRFRLFEGDTLSPTIFLYDGTQNASPSGEFAFRRKTLKPGSLVRIRAEAIDQQTYTYYSQLADLTGGGMMPAAGTAAPANPVTNLSGGALGIFAAMSVREIAVKVP